MTEELPPCPFCGGNGEKNDIKQTVVDDRDTGCWHCEIFMTKNDWQSRPLETAAYIRGLRRAVEICGITLPEENMHEVAPFRSQIVEEMQKAIQEAQS